MRKRATFSLYVSSQRGIALILTLGIITLVTLMLIAFVVSMRVENTASKNFNDVVKARELAHGAVDQVVATIRQGTTRGASLLNYVTFPGVIYDYDGTASTRVPLYSQAAALAPPSDTFDFNKDFWITANNGEFPGTGNAVINAGWIYVADDGTLAPPNVYPMPAPKSIIGRFAFWVDDEASKINLNTAGAPTVPALPDYGSSVSNDVDLSMLWPNLNTPAMINAIRTRQASPGFTTIEEVKLADPGITDPDFTANRFSVTTYSSDANYPNYIDDLDAFGRQRRPLFSGVIPVSEAADITDTGINGAYGRMTDAATLGKIYSGTFATKYPVVGVADGVKQIIANIIAYQIDPTVTPPPDNGSSPPVYLGLAKTPYINEVQISYVIDSTFSPSTVTRSVSVELFYMYDGTYTPGIEQIVVSGLPTAGGLFSPVATITPPGGLYASGTYRVCPEPAEAAVDLAAITPVTPPVTPTQVAYTRQYGGPKRLDYAEMNLLQVSLDPSASATIYQDAEANDPAANDTDGQWAKTTTSGTLGLQNAAYSQTSDPTLLPKAIPSKSVMRGAPMQSLGELGYIHRPESWRYLTLQPGGGGGGVIPDWAILDLFTVGNIVIPNDTVTGGRININSFINPGLTIPAPSSPRLVPLKALLNSVITPPFAIALRVYNIIGARADAYGMKDPVTADPVFDTIGELCEVPGVADDPLKSEADREAAIRHIANLITVRSQEFTIWVMAQGIKDVNKDGAYNPPPGVNNNDFVTGEVRAQAVVERYEAGGVPKFRVRYFRYLY